MLKPQMANVSPFSKPGARRPPGQAHGSGRERRLSKANVDSGPPAQGGRFHHRSQRSQEGEHQDGQNLPETPFLESLERLILALALISLGWVMSPT